jgi:hypothetical protein
MKVAFKQPYVPFFLKILMNSVDDLNSIIIVDLDVTMLSIVN